MMQISTWEVGFLEPFLAIGLLAIGYIIYYFFTQSSRVLITYQKRFGNVKGAERFIWTGRYLGGLLIGVLPLLLLISVTDKNPHDYGFGFKNSLLSLYWILGLSALIIPITFLSARRVESWKEYPQVRTRTWTIPMMWHNAFTWVFYLFGYELMFRGILLFATIEFMGEWPAIILNTALYALVHIPKSLKETIGAVPFGLVLCLITISTGTFWVAFIVHIVMAVSTFLFSLKFNPEMKLV